MHWESIRPASVLREPSNTRVRARCENRHKSYIYIYIYICWVLKCIGSPSELSVCYVMPSSMKVRARCKCRQSSLILYTGY